MCADINMCCYDQRVHMYMSYRSYTGRRSYNFVNNFDEVITSLHLNDEVITSMVPFVEVTTSTVYFVEVTFFTYLSYESTENKYLIMKTTKK